MMSVPMATWTVTGTCRRAAAASTLARANCGCFAARNRPTACPRPRPARDAVVDRAVQQAAGLLGHAEAAGTERFVDVLGRGADQRDLEVVNDRGAVGGDRRHEAALHQVDQHRTEPGLDHVRAEAPDDAAAARFASTSARTTALKSAAARMSGSASTNAPTDAPGTCGRAEILRARLARARFQRIGADVGQIEFFVGKRITGRAYASKRKSKAKQMNCVFRFASCNFRESAWHRRSCKSDSARRSPPRYAASTRSRPANADTSISSDDRGRWKFVSRPRITRNSKPGKMNRPVAPAPATMRPVVLARHRLQRPRRRRADGDDATAAVERAVDRRGRRFVDLIALRLEPVILDPFGPDRLERAVADVQRDLGDADAATRERRRERRAEVQARRRRGDRSARAREDRLIPLAVLAAIVALDVRRQRHVADRVDGFVERRAVVGPQADDAAAVKSPFEHLAVQRPRRPRTRPGRPDAASAPDASALPSVRPRTVPERPASQPGDEQALHRAAARHATAEQTRGKHARVVDDEQIALGEQIGKRGDRRVAMAPVSRRRHSSRAAPRSAAGSCAIRCEGRSKSKSRTSIRASC